MKGTHDLHGHPAMAKRDSTYRCYTIPENVIDGGRVMGFKIRNIAEGVILGGIFAIIGLIVLPGEAITDKLSGLVIIAVPPMLLGAIGINGYPLSIFAKNVSMWLKGRGTILYNPSIRLLKASPVENAMEQKDLRDRLAGWYELYQSKVQAGNKDGSEELIEGVTFRFASDKEEEGLVISQPVAKSQADEMEVLEESGIEIIETPPKVVVEEPLAAEKGEEETIFEEMSFEIPIMDNPDGPENDSEPSEVSELAEKEPALKTAPEAKEKENSGSVSSKTKSKKKRHKKKKS